MLEGISSPPVCSGSHDGLSIGRASWPLACTPGKNIIFASDGLFETIMSRSLEDREGNIRVATGDGLDRFRDFAVPHDFCQTGFVECFIRLAAKDGSVWLAVLRA